MIITGSVVKSIAGRDKNRYYMVLRTEGDFAYIADGKVHKLKTPKKKRLKHLKATLAVVHPGTVLTDRQLRAAMARIGGSTHEMLYQEGSEPIG